MFDTLSEKFQEAFKNLKGQGKITEANIDETLKQVRTALLEADVNFKVVKEFLAKVKSEALGQKVIQGVRPGEQFVKIIHDELAHLMGSENETINWDTGKLKSVLVVGLNGAGKTTFCGKLSLFLKNKQNKNVLLVPCDTMRPAAKDQLITLAKQIGVEYFDSDLSLSPRDIALQGLEAARRERKDVVIFDTAGRLHVDNELMGELKELKAALQSESPETLLVADAMTGQEAVNVAKSFHEAVQLTGTVLSKMDSDARGGAALSIRQVTGVPIRFISVGEKLKDLELFHPDRLAGRILDMGDVVTLVEKAQEVVDEKEAERMMKNMEKNRFTIDDFVKQMETMGKLGSMESLLKMIPGMGGMLRQIGDLGPAEAEMKKMRVIISSMTKQERQDEKLFKQQQGRINRVAKGSGTNPQDVREFLNKFAQMKQMMSGLFGMMKGGGLGLPGLGGGGERPMKGFRQPPGGGGGFPGLPGQTKKKGKKKSPYARFRR